MFFSSINKPKLESQQTQDSMQFTKCQRCHQYQNNETFKNHLKCCGTSPRISQLDEIHRSLKEITECAEKQLRNLNTTSVKAKYLQRICEICKQVHQIVTFNSLGQRKLYDLEQEVQVLTRNDEIPSRTVAILLNRLANSISRKIQVFSSRERYLSDQSSPKHGATLTEDYIGKTKTFQEHKRKFFTLCLEQKLRLDSKSPAHKLKVNELYNQAISHHVRPEEWTYFISKCFNTSNKQ